MTTHRGGVFNADNHRGWQGAQDIAALVREHDLDWLAVVEASGYARRTRWLLRRTHRVFTGHGSTSRSDSMLIVRRGIPARWKHVHNLRTGGWERDPRNARFGLHDGRHMVSLRLGHRGKRYRVAAVHLPPGPNHARTSSFPRRWQAFCAGLRALEQIAGRWGERSLVGWVLAGDWNAHTDRRDFRNWLARVDADAKGHGIDFPVWSGVHVTNVRSVPAGGDHKHAVLFDVTT